MAKTPVRNRPTKADLEHDEVIEYTEHAAVFLKTHANKIMLALAAVFAIYAIFVFFHQKKEGRLALASDEYYSASQIFDESLGMHPWASKERSEGMARVVAKTQDIIDTYGDTAVARNAVFLQANAYYFAGDKLGTTANTEESIAIFQRYATMAEERGDVFERAAALLALGYAHENLHLLTLPTDPDRAQQALTAAAAYYDQVVQLADAGFLKYEAMNAQARLLEYLKKPDDARKMYEQVIRERYRVPEEPAEDSPDRERIMYQLRLIANQYTTGNSALVALRQMGVDTDALLEEIKDETKS